MSKEENKTTTLSTVRIVMGDDIIKGSTPRMGNPPPPPPKTNTSNNTK